MTMSTVTPTTRLGTGPRFAAPRKPETLVLIAVFLFLGLWALAIVLFGVPGLFLPALALVPVMLTVLVVIAWG